MKIERSKDLNVSPEGIPCDRIGELYVKGKLLRSVNNEFGGCSENKCNCSPGHWLTLVLPRTEDGTVEYINITFDDKSEFDELLSEFNL